MIPCPQDNGRTCGQAVVASILECPLNEAVKLIGHKHGTVTREIVKALRSHGVPVSDRLRSATFEQLPSRAILKATIKSRCNWHWMLLWDGQLIDPSAHKPLKKVCCISAFLEIQEAN